MSGEFGREIELIEWSKLPSYTKDGKFTVEVTIKVDKEGIRGGARKPDFSRFLTEKHGVSSRLLLVSGVRIYVSKEVGFLFPYIIWLF